MTKIRGEQSVFGALGAGIVAGCASALVWGFIAKATQYEIGWLAIGVGFLVGYAVQKFGKGVDLQFRFIGAGIALLAIVAGHGNSSETPCGASRWDRPTSSRARTVRAEAPNGFSACLADPCRRHARRSTANPGRASSEPHAGRRNP